VDVVGKLSSHATTAEHEALCLSCQYLRGWHPGCDAVGTPTVYQVLSESLQLTDPALFDKGVANFMAMHARDAQVPAERIVKDLMKSVGLTRPWTEVDFCYGGVFAVHRDMIVQHPRSTYERLMEEYFKAVPEGQSPQKWNCEDCEAKPTAGYVYELLWMHIFSSDSVSKSKRRAGKQQRKACKKRCRKSDEHSSCVKDCSASVGFLH
jgi:hypothetical protein